METFEINNKKYFVKWTHSQSEVKTTMCEIFDTDGFEKDIPITYSYSKLSSKDKNFSKKIGRRLSFQRSLLGSFNKDERTKIWKYAFEHFSTKLKSDEKKELIKQMKNFIRVS